MAWAMGQAWFSSAPLTVAEFIAPAYTIALEKDHYLPGDTLQGYVSLEVHEPTPFCAIEVRVCATRVSNKIWLRRDGTLPSLLLREKYPRVVASCALR